jgi:hypothetical protein
MAEADGPIFVVAPPRAGARLVGRALAASPATWEVPDGWSGGAFTRLGADDCTPEVRARLQRDIARHAPGTPARMLDASPRHALAVPFLHAAFPRARFVYVHRRPVDALAEALAIWRAGNAVTHPDLPGWPGPPWSFLLVPGWEELAGRPLPEIVTEQWVRTMRVLVQDLESLPPASWGVADHDSLLSDPAGAFERLLGFLGLEADTAAAEAFARMVRRDLAVRDVRAAHDELAPYLGRTRELAARAREWFPSGPSAARSDLAT